MSSRLQISDELIDRADRLLERIEAAGESFSRPEFAACLQDVVNLLGARQTSLSLFDGTLLTCLAGESTDAVKTLLADQRLAEDAVHRIELPASTSMLVASSIGPDSRLILESVFDSASQCAEFDELFVAMIDAFALVVRSQRLAQLERAMEGQRRLGAFCRSLHAIQDPRLLASQIATDGAAVMGVDRVSVLRRRNGQAEVFAVTGVADVNERANETRFLQTVAQHAKFADNSVWNLSDQLATALGCTDTAPSTTRHTRIVCDGNRNHEAVFVLECFDDAPADSSVADEVLAHANLAMTNAWEMNERGLAGSIRRGGDFLRRRSMLFFLSLLAAVVVALSVIPATFEISCRGNLQPIQQQFILAPSHGTVVFASENEAAIRAGDPVITIHNAQLELEASRLQGEIRTAGAKLQSLQADRSNATDHPLISEAEVTEQILGLTKQLEIVQRELQVLHVTSLVDGTVYRNDLTVDLVRTTVQPGQPLMHLVNPDGDWQVQLRIPDKLIRHVLQASDNRNRRLPVRLMLRTDPSIAFDGQLISIGSASQIDVRNELTVPATVAFQSEPIELRPGSEVLAKIDCGGRSLGFVLFREMIEFVQSRVLF